MRTLATPRNNVGLAWALVLCTVLPVSARVIYVDDDANAPGDGASWWTAFKYLNDALWEADDEDEVRVAEGVYRPDRIAGGWWREGDREVSFYVGGKRVLEGGYAGLGHPDPNARDVAAYPTILTGDLLGNDVNEPPDWWNAPTRSDNSYCVVYIGSGVLDGFVVTGGQAQACRRWPQDCVVEPWCLYSDGGGLWVRAENATVKDCVFTRNYAENRGGGVYVCDTKGAVFTGCTFTSNLAWWGGGAGMCVAENSSIEVTDCNFAANLGEGLLIQSSVATVTDGRFLENYGAVRAYDGSAVRLSECVLRGNRGSIGGALRLGYAEMEVADSCLVGNWTTGRGGAISISSLGSLHLTRCRLSGNQAGEGGGAIANLSGTMTMQNCTIADNKAPRGSALFDGPFYSTSSAGRISISNCILSNDADEIWSDDGAITVAYSAIQGGRDAIDNPGDVDWGPGNLDVDPCFADPGYWDPNGTPDDPNDDSWVDGDYHLKSQAGRWDPNSESWVIDDITSPCIDAGDPNSLVGDEPPPNGGRINMGAYGGTAEASKSYLGEPLCETIIASDINGDCRVDFADLAILIDHWHENRGE